MAYIVRNKKFKKSFLVRGKDQWEFYWTCDERRATQFKTTQEVTEYLSGRDINEIEIVDSSEVIPTPAPLTLGNLPEGKKFQYADQPNGYVFMKVLQPFPDNPSDESHIGDTDARYYLHAAPFASWIIILDNQGDTHPQTRIGRIILLNNDVLVREVQ